MAKLVSDGFFLTLPAAAAEPSETCFNLSADIMFLLFTISVAAVANF